MLPIAVRNDTHALSSKPLASHQATMPSWASSGPPLFPGRPEFHWRGIMLHLKMQQGGSSTESPRQLETVPVGDPAGLPCPLCDMVTLIPRGSLVYKDVKPQSIDGSVISMDRAPRPSRGLGAHRARKGSSRLWLTPGFAFTMAPCLLAV